MDAKQSLHCVFITKDQFLFIDERVIWGCQVELTLYVYN